MTGASLRFVTLLALALAFSGGCGDGGGFDPPPGSHRPIVGPLRVHRGNPRYFAGTDGRAVLLTGSHTWSNLQDNGTSDPPPRFDYGKYLDFLVAHNHNFFRLWSWEQAKWTAEIDGDYWIGPMPYLRTGPGLARDGKPKFDLTRFDQAYFDRLRERVREAGRRGIYVSVMLFDGWSIEEKGKGKMNPWEGHPFHADNNVNGIDGDLDGDGQGSEVHTLAAPAITAIQEAYVRKVVETVGDLDNVLYEISNESPVGSEPWQYHMIRYIKDLEARRSKRHPVGMTVSWPNGSNAELFDSPADWISPNGGTSDPPVADGSKVILDDTDHLCGICGDPAWVWKSFMRGRNPIFMDPYDGKAIGLGAPDDFDPDEARWVGIRRNMGYALAFASRVDLGSMVPRGDLASSRYCLANAVASGAEYLVYLPSGGSVEVDLSATPGALEVEWFSPATGTSVPGYRVTGGATRTFTAPFRGDAVLYLRG